MCCILTVFEWMWHYKLVLWGFIHGSVNCTLYLGRGGELSILARRYGLWLSLPAPSTGNWIQGFACATSSTWVSLKKCLYLDDVLAWPWSDSVPLRACGPPASASCRWDHRPEPSSLTQLLWKPKFYMRSSSVCHLGWRGTGEMDSVRATGSWDVIVWIMASNVEVISFSFSFFNYEKDLSWFWHNQDKLGPRVLFCLGHERQVKLSGWVW